MVDIFNLALPYFGLIFIGFACGKAKSLPESGLGWMNFSSSMHPCRRCCSGSCPRVFCGTQQPAVSPADQGRLRGRTDGGAACSPPGCVTLTSIM
jgi:hypothetical protein